MKIVFLVHRYWPSVGGVEKYVHELGRALVDAGHEVDVVAGAHTVDLPSREAHDGIRIHRFPALRSPLRCRWELWRMRHLFKRADVVSVSNTHMLEYYWRMLGPWVDPRKTFLIRHGMACTYPVPDSQKQRAFRSLALVSGVIHDGNFIEKWLEVAPDLCPDQGLSPTAADLQPIPEPEPESAVYIGRLEPDTGIGIYLDAVRILTHRQKRRFRLDVYGDGTLMPALKGTVERDALPVEFHGRVADAQRFITDSCFAFLDGRMAIQEAMARQRLVFAAYGDPLKHDYVGAESFSPHVVTVATGEDLAAQVEYYIEHLPARAALVSQAFNHAKMLTWTRTAQMYSTFWQTQLANPRPGLSRLCGARLAWLFEREARAVKHEVCRPQPELPLPGAPAASAATVPVT